MQVNFEEIDFKVVYFSCLLISLIIQKKNEKRKIILFNNKNHGSQ